MRATDWLKTSGNVIAYYPKLAKPLGSVNAAILFGQLFYWQDKATSELGVYKTQEEIENETGLSRREQESARKNMRDRGILIETHKRLEHRLYFKLDLDKFNEMMEEYAAVSQCNNAPPANGGNSQPRMAETDIREATKPPFVIQEITTENTTEITTQNNPLPPEGNLPGGKHASAGKTKPKLTVDYHAVMEAYNDINEVTGSRLPFAETLNDKRKRQIKKLLQSLQNPTVECAKNYFMAFFEAARPFHFGENDREWRASFDYVLRPDTLVKVREGAL